MNKETLYNFLPSVGIDDDKLDILYSFTSGSGNLVFNELHDNSGHFLSGDVRYVDGSVYPGITTGDGNPSSSSSGGTGNFNGNDSIEILPSYTPNNWTFFINFSGATVPTGSEGVVLATTEQNTHLSFMTDENGNTYLQASEVSDAITSGGLPTRELRTLYTSDWDATAINMELPDAIPAYTGYLFPYVFVKGRMTLDSAITGHNISTSGFRGKDLLMINGYPAYQYRGDTSIYSANAIHLDHAWSGFKGNQNSDTFPHQPHALEGTPTISTGVYKGFTFGVNCSNRPYVEFTTLSGKKTYTSINELNDKNIISVAKDDNSISIQSHDYLSDHHYFEKFDLESDFNNSIYWRIGGLNKWGPLSFSGQIEDFVLFSGALNSGTRTKISECFMLNKYSGERWVNTDYYDNVITGSTISFSGITGSGITGHETILSASISNNNVYTQSGLTGVLKGGIETTYLTGSGIVRSLPKVTGEFKDINHAYASNYGNNNLAFFKEVTDGERYEIYSQFTKNTGVGLLGRFYPPTSGFSLDDTYVTGRPVNIFKNGYAKFSGTDYSFVSGTVVFNNASSPSDVVIYDYASGMAGQLVSGFTDTSYVGTVEVTGEKYFYKDIYLNGKKLIEGYNYLRAWGGQDTIIQKSTLQETGEFLFIPRINGDIPTGVYYFNIKTGIGTNFVTTDFRMASEQVWLSGIRQREGYDYSTISNKSKLANNSFVSGFTAQIYLNEGTFYNH